MKISIFILVVLMSLNIVFAENVKILFNSDSHGTLYPCNCPRNPAGGLARRAKLIDSLRYRFNDSLIVLDGGDFSGGGKYDLHSEGFRNVDSVRTIGVLKSLKIMNYTAINIGDEDLNFGIKFLKKYRDLLDLPFVSLNIVDKKNKNIFLPFIEKKVQGKKILITGIVLDNTKDKKGYKILSPINSLRKLVKNKKFDYLMVLNHCGQDSLLKIANLINELKLTNKTMIFNSHYKKGLGYKSKTNNIWTISFNYTSKLIHYIDLDLSTNNINYFSLINLGLRIGNDDNVVSALKEYEDRRSGIIIGQYSKAKLDLFVMAHCPYCPDAIRSLISLVKNDTSIDWNIYYIFKKNKNGELQSMHGKEEMDEDILQIALQKYNKNKFLRFLELRYGQNKLSVHDILKQLNINKDSLLRSKKIDISSFLSYDKKLLKRYNVNASPTLLINGKRFNRDIKIGFVQKKLCEYKNYNFCEDVPQCFDDSDCKLPGKIGKCLNPSTKQSKCVYMDDEKFDFTVLYDSLAFFKYDTNIVSSTKEIFPSVYIKFIKSNSLEGKRIIEKYKLKRLPFYFASKNIEKAARFDLVKNSFIRTESSYILSTKDIFKSIMLNRDYKKGDIRFFFMPLGNVDMNILSMARDLYNSKRFSDIGFLYQFSDDIMSKLNNQEVLKMEYIKNKGKIVEYLKSFIENGPSMYYNKYSVKKEDVKKLKLTDYKNIFKGIELKSSMYILLNNKELLPIGSEDDFYRIISFSDRNR